MKKAGKSLRKVLEKYHINQNQLAIAMGTGRSTVHQWVRETRDPTADAVLAILKGLHKLEPEAAKEFIKLYLEDFVEV